MARDGADRLPLIDDFLHALRNRKIDIGPREIDRLRLLFARQPDLDRHGLKTLLRAVLLKNSAQRDVFDALFDDWCPDQDAVWRPVPAPEHEATRAALAAEEGESESGVDEMLAPPWWRSAWLHVPAGCVVLALTLFLIWPLLFPPPPPLVIIEEQPQRIDVEEHEPPSGASDELPAIPVDRVWYWHTDIDPEAVYTPALLDRPKLALLGLAALAIAAFLLLRHRGRFPELRPGKREESGPRWQPLPAAASAPLIAPQERRRVLWHIEHFVSDQPTRRLDIERTVRSTARAAGFVRVHYQPATYERGVRFWIDRQLRSPNVNQATAELAATLRAGGIEVQQGYFTDAPHRVDDDRQRAYRPIHEEGSGREAIVAILSDGEGLTRQFEHLLQRQRVERLLRSLRHWPRLCFVDCSASGRRIAELFERHHVRLPVITLDQLPTWLGGLSGGGARRPDRLVGEEWRWAAALALGGATATPDDTRALRERTDLPTDPWRVERILAEVADPERRAALINRLLRSEPTSGNGELPRRSLARQATAWWLMRYRNADRDAIARENPLLPWRGSPAQRRWALESELLRLYSDPVEAVEQLVKRVKDDAVLAGELRARLGEFLAADDPRPDTDRVVRFTWRFGELPIETRHRLQQLGFPIDAERQPSPIPAPLALSAFALIGLGLAALAAAAVYTPPPPRLLHAAPYDDPVLAAQTLRLVEPLSAGDRFRVLAGSMRGLVQPLEVGTAAIAPVRWTWAAQDNKYAFENSDSFENSVSRVWRAGTLPQPIRGCGEHWPARSLVIIQAPEDDVPARQLAIRLLDLGSADQVLIGPDWPDQLDDWLGPSRTLNEQTQLLLMLRDDADTAAAASTLGDLAGPWAIVSTADFAEPARALADPDRDLRGVRPLNETDLPWERGPSQGTVYLYGGPQRTEDRGLTWLGICPGSFTLGELDSEHNIVALSAFDMTATEITVAQYAALVPEADMDKSDGELPMASINWEQARTACQRAGGDLPTEAQWEYAARGGSRTGWSFGNDEAELGNYAWYAGNASQAQPVGRLAPNPLGLYDMHGNVWEWVLDWYGVYPAAEIPQIDPRGPSSGSSRVLRGGSFDYSPEDLRSADRGDFFPEVRSQFGGFRCVRVPPQP